MKRILPYITILAIILFYGRSNAQTDTEFWFVAPEVSQNHGDYPVLLRITTANLPADVEITMPQNTANFPTLNYSVPANSTQTIDLTALGLQGEVEHFYDFLDGVFGKSNKGIYITSTNPITVYYEVNKSNNCDIFALKGKNALGTEFYGVFQNYGYNMSNNWAFPAYSALEIVATADGTIVTFESTQGQDFWGYGVGTFSVTLDRGETFSLVPDWLTDPPRPGTLPGCATGSYGTDVFGRAGPDHLSGVRITTQDADHPIAVTKKDDSVRYRCIDAWEGGCYDLIGDQLVPLDILGLEYIAMRGGLYGIGEDPSSNREAPENLYIVATEDNTDIFIDGVFETNIDEGETYMYEFWATGNPFVHVRGDKKLSVLHVSGFGCEVGGAILPPTDKCTGSTQVAITRATSEGFFINLMVWTGAEDEFYINGVLQDVDGGDLPNGVFFGPGDFTPLPSSPNWLVWRSSNIATGDIGVGVSTLVQNTEDVFHLGVINGGLSSGCRFGYFSDFNELKVEAEATGSGTGEIRACGYEQIQLYSSGGTNFNWWPANYLNDPTISEPIADPPSGTTTIFFVEVSGACGLTDTATVTVTKFPDVEAQFSVDKGNGCSPLDIILHETSTQIYERYWDFNFSGIGGILDRDTILYFDYANRDTDTTFVHTFINTTNEADPDSIQTYDVRLLVKNSNDCADTAYASIIVYPEVTADFTLTDLNDTIGCNPLAVSYVDNSNNEDFYYWKFGDGVSSTDTNPTHLFTNNLDAAKVYNTELIVRSVHFCRDTVNMDITVYPYLEAGFTIDTYEGCSPLDVLINSNSVFEDSIVLVYGDGDTLKTGSLGAVLHTYENKSTTVDTNTIELWVFNDEGCQEVWYDTVIVYPEVVADYAIDPYSDCNSDTVTFHNNSNDGTHTAWRYFWEFADGTSMDTTNNTIEKFYNNTTSGDKTYNFRMTARSVYGCTDDTTNSIDMYRAYANFTVDNNEGCSPIEVSITNISIGDDIPLLTGWNWDYGDGIGTSTDKDPFPYTYNNTGFVNDTNKLVLEVIGTNGCSTRDSVDIIVYPNIKATYTTTLTSVASCDSLVADFDSDLFHPALPSVVYEWDFGDGGTSADVDPSHTYRNLLSPNLLNRRVDLRVETDMGCVYDTSSFINVYPMVRADISVDKTEGCSPLTIDVSALGFPGNDSYDWDYGDAIGTNTNQDPVAYTYPANPPGANDVYTLRLDVEDQYGVCTDFATETITVFDESFADFNPKNSTDCDPYTVTFDNLSVNSLTYKWDFDDGGTTSTGFEPTYEFVNDLSSTRIFNVELEVTSDEGCTDVFSSPVNVLPTIEADFDIDVSAGCSPLTVTISNNFVGDSCFWYWDKNDRVINTSGADSTIDFGTFTKTFINNSGVSRTDSLTLIVGNGNGCYEIFKRAITIHSSIDAEFTFTPASGEGCNPLTVEFTNTTVGASSYNWSFGDGSSTTTASPDNIFTNTAIDDKTFDVRLTAESTEGCTDSEETTITVYSKVISDFSIATSEGCPPFSTTIDNTSIGNGANTFQWFIDNVLVGSAPTDDSDFDHTYNNTVTTVRDYEVKLIATNPHGCTSEHTDDVTVYEYVEASFSMDVDEGCTPLVVDFTDLSSVPASTKYTWDFGDGASSGLSDPDHTFYNSSRTTDLTRTIDLTVQSPNYCSDDTSLTVDIYHQPFAKFYIDKTTSCPPLQSTLTKLWEGADMFEWRLEEGVTNTTDENLSYSWDNADINNIRTIELELWVGTVNNCKDSSSLDLSVFPNVTADYTIDNNAGCSPLENVQFTNASSSPATQFFWSFGDGTTTNLEDPVHDFTNIGITDRIYDILLRASSEYNCWDTITKQVTVYVQPEAEFYVDPVLLTYPDNIVGIDNQTNTGPFDFLWNIGNIDNSTSTEQEPGSFEYGHWGEKVIKLTATSQTNSECTSTFSDTILIQPPKVNAAFITDIDGGCWDGGLEVQFMAASSAYAEEYTYEWDFGDGETTTGQNVSHIFENVGTYNVQLKASSTEGAGEDYEYKRISVYANPEVSFEVSPKLAMIDATTLEARVKFYNTSLCNDTAGCAYTWYFGDGNSAISKDYTHGYEELGKYDVTLLAVSANGCRDSLTLYEEVEILGAGEIAFPNAFTPDGTGPAENETFRPLAEGVIEYELFIYNRWGELIFTTKDLSVGWDGTIDGELAKPDVYVWKSIGKFTNGRSFELAGDVTLIR